MGRFDLSNEEWAVIEPLLPPQVRGAGLPYLCGPTVVLESAGLFSSAHAASP